MGKLINSKRKEDSGQTPAALGDAAQARDSCLRQSSGPGGFPA
jgi:hypothetical protein